MEANLNDFAQVRVDISIDQHLAVAIPRVWQALTRYNPFVNDEGNAAQFAKRLGQQSAWVRSLRFLKVYMTVSMTTRTRLHASGSKSCGFDCTAMA